MTRPRITQNVTFIYTRDLVAGSAFLREKLELDIILNQSDLCHIYRLSETAFLGVCRNREPPPDPGVTITFVTPDVDRMYERLKARGVIFDGPPELSQRFNVYACFFRGIENYRFEIQSFLDPAWPAPR